MKKTILILLLLVLISVSSCNNKDSGTDILTYELEEQFYTQEEAATIKYPEIVSDDSNLSESLNKLISEYIEEYLNERINGISNFLLDIDYEVKEKQDDLLSIFFYGSLTVENAAHPSYIVFTINLDTINYKRLTITDFTNDFDSIADLLLSSESKEDAALNYLQKEYSRYEIIAKLESSDQGIGWSSFVQDDTLGIVILLPYSMGGYSTLTVKQLQ